MSEESESQLKKLMSLCKAGIYIEINGHKNSYTTVDGHIASLNMEEGEIPEDTMRRMIDTDTIVDVHFYPQTPVGFYKVVDADVDLALTRAVAIATEDQQRQ